MAIEVIIGVVAQIEGLFYAFVDGGRMKRQLYIGDTLFSNETISGDSNNAGSALLKIEDNNKKEVATILRRDSLRCDASLLKSGYERDQVAIEYDAIEFFLDLMHNKKLRAPEDDLATYEPYKFATNDNDGASLEKKGDTFSSKEEGEDIDKYKLVYRDGVHRIRDDIKLDVLSSDKYVFDITNNTRPLLSGNVEPNASVTIYVDEQVFATKADKHGNWKVKVPTNFGDTNEYENDQESLTAEELISDDKPIIDEKEIDEIAESKESKVLNREVGSYTLESDDDIDIPQSELITKPATPKAMISSDGTLKFSDENESTQNKKKTPFQLPLKIDKPIISELFNSRQTTLLTKQNIEMNENSSPFKVSIYAIAKNSSYLSNDGRLTLENIGYDKSDYSAEDAVIFDFKSPIDESTFSLNGSYGESTIWRAYNASGEELKKGIVDYSALKSDEATIKINFEKAYRYLLFEGSKNSTGFKVKHVTFEGTVFKLYEREFNLSLRDEKFIKIEFESGYAASFLEIELDITSKIETGSVYFVAYDESHRIIKDKLVIDTSMRKGALSVKVIPNELFYSLQIVGRDASNVTVLSAVGEIKKVSREFVYEYPVDIKSEPKYFNSNDFHISIMGVKAGCSIKVNGVEMDRDKFGAYLLKQSEKSFVISSNEELQERELESIRAQAQAL